MSTLVVAIIGAIVGSILTWYLQRRWTPDPAAAVVELRKELAGIRQEFAQYQQNAEQREKDRAEFEDFPLEFAFRQGVPQNYYGQATNNSKYKISVDSIRIFRGDVAHESALTEDLKPRPTDDWTLEPAASKTLYWAPQYDPASTLRNDPNVPKGHSIPIVSVLTIRVNGKPVFKKKYTQQVIVQGNQLLPWGP